MSSARTNAVTAVSEAKPVAVPAQSKPAIVAALSDGSAGASHAVPQTEAKGERFAVERAEPLVPPFFDAAYLHNPPPRYPLAARLKGEQGIVTLKVLVTREGLPGSVTLEKTSGHPLLDAAALRTVRQWRFVPARRGGQAIDASLVVPIRFRLEDAS